MVRSVILAAAFLLASTAFADAADFTVNMLNKGADGQAMVFEPALTEIAVGDTVTFVAKDKGHNAHTIPGMLPKGATPLAGQIGTDLKVTFTVSGVYGIKCLPHFGMGMAALVVVGDIPPDNLADAQAATVPPLAKKRLDPLFAELAKQ